MKVEVQTLAAVVALIISIITWIRGERFQKAMRKSQAEHEALQSNMSLLFNLWSDIGNTPSILKFHGITQEDLNDVGIDAKELAYLIASFQAADYYFEHIEKEIGPFPPDTLRYDMCANEAVQRAWPLLKRFLIDSPRYVSRIEETMKLHRKERETERLFQAKLV